MALNFTRVTNKELFCPFFLFLKIPGCPPCKKNPFPVFCYPRVSTSSLFKYPKLFSAQKLNYGKKNAA